MIEQDTVKLLRECDAGIKMGIASIDDVMDHVKSEDLHHHLDRCRQEHDALQAEIQTLLGKYHDEGKNPNPIVKGMSWMKTNMKLGMEDSDRVVADLMSTSYSLIFCPPSICAACARSRLRSADEPPTVP